MTAFIPPGQDLDPIEASVQERLRDTVAALKHIENGEVLTEDFVRTVTAPAALTLISSESSPGRLAHNTRTQVAEIELSIGVVTESRGARLGGGSATLRRAIVESIVGLLDTWRPTGAQRAFTYSGRVFEGREGSRACQTLKFKTTALVG